MLHHYTFYLSMHGPFRNIPGTFKTIELNLFCGETEGCMIALDMTCLYFISHVKLYPAFMYFSSGQNPNYFSSVTTNVI